MDKLVDLLEQYGLKFTKPRTERSKEEIKDWIEVEKGEKFILDDAFYLIKSEGINIKIKDFAKAQERLELPEEWLSINKDLVETLVLRTKVTGRRLDKTLKVEGKLNTDKIAYELKEIIVADMTLNGEKYGLYPEQIKLNKMFGQGDLLEKKARELYKQFNSLCDSSTDEFQNKNFWRELGELLMESDSETAKFQKLFEE